MSACFESKKLEHYHSSRERLETEGASHATNVAKANSALNGLFDGGSLGKCLSIVFLLIN